MAEWVLLSENPSRSICYNKESRIASLAKSVGNVSLLCRNDRICPKLGQSGELVTDAYEPQKNPAQ